jgi:hypothetical protein
MSNCSRTKTISSSADVLLRRRGLRLAARRRSCLRGKNCNIHECMNNDLLVRSSVAGVKKEGKVKVNVAAGQGGQPQHEAVMRVQWQGSECNPESQKKTHIRILKRIEPRMPIGNLFHLSPS